MKKISLPDNRMPKKWYNIQADIGPTDPPLDPETNKPMEPSKLAVLFPVSLLDQEVSTERWIDIPEEVLDIYKIWRPTPLIRAERLEKYLDTPAKIYFKYEGVSPAGSHKPNTAVPQVYYNAKEGIKSLTTETGAGQWGSSLCFAGQYFGVDVLVYMVKVSYHQKPYRRVLMETWGGKVIASPSNTTESGKKILEINPDSPGSLGIAISEAVEVAIKSGGKAHYALGSVLNHVLLHQTVIGLEAKEQFETINDYPDIIIGCAGGGSNFAGIAFPFIPDKMNKKKDLRIIAVEPASCPSLTKGKFEYDFGDVAGFTPLLKMYTLGHDFVPPSIHAGGLRYHGMAPLVSKIYHEKLIEAVAIPQKETFQAAITFARTEGLIPAPESAHAIAATIREALECKKRKESKTILFNLSGHGFLDLGAYQMFLEGKLE
ncbi:MAG TPA: TrpB-like pyridoxal phosphate-dependent enzyme [Spirochaetota bacterium]|nr:TrpB-like pyridoxal phosphate-dependent enzyme [Spirochaetota bacterium]HOM37648.1 TrpB-like pyridoxal phosphate-dependent enzyme [Spirochaetota bacterium]HPQ49606.1 TrpB-like pyridoxal phosphate-dependent enzyme [Spirochaetota bacterium]